MAEYQALKAGWFMLLLLVSLSADGVSAARKLVSSNSCLREPNNPSSNCNFMCPENSCIREGIMCVDNLNDCVCEEGYHPTAAGLCEKPIEPPSSKPPSSKPPSSSNSYKCPEVEKSDNCNFECPENSCAKENVMCVDNISDCECNSGFKLSVAGTCEKGGSASHPTNDDEDDGKDGHEPIVDCPNGLAYNLATQECLAAITRPHPACAEGFTMVIVDQRHMIIDCYKRN